MNITNELLKKHHACREGCKWFLNQNDSKHDVVLLKLVEENHYDWANWLIVRLLNKKQKTQYAVFAAECVIFIYEEKYPDDSRPREAIQAAKACIEHNTKKDRAAAYAAAAYAAYAAAWAAAYAADAAADAAAYAADAADDAADVKTKIIKYGSGLIS